MMKEQEFHPFNPTGMHSHLPDFMDKIEQLAELIGLPIKQLTIDHIAMRINDVVEAEQAHFLWNPLGSVISDAIINERPIIVIKLFQSLSLGDDWQTDCVEIPYPAKHKTYPQQGWEHVECVVPSQQTDCQAYLNELKDQFPDVRQRWPQLEQHHVQVTLSVPKGAGERLSNPTIAFKWRNICLKVHPYSLEQVIRSEQDQPIS